MSLVVGMHLCGALSPRLIDLVVAVESIDAMVLCPCCLKVDLRAEPDLYSHLEAMILIQCTL